jgi:putative addiction module killer protein
MFFTDSTLNPRPTEPLTKVTNVLPLDMIDVREYLDRDGRSPYARWFDHLNAPAAAKVAAALTRIAQGNLSNVKGVGGGVFEYKIDFGPGWRIYFGKDGDRLVILLGGGTKKRQENDINRAIARWQDYRQRKKE